MLIPVCPVSYREGLAEGHPSLGQPAYPEIPLQVRAVPHMQRSVPMETAKQHLRRCRRGLRVSQPQVSSPQALIRIVVSLAVSIDYSNHGESR